MLIRRRRVFWIGVALLLVGASFLVFPPYERYCEGYSPNNYYCSAYGVVVAFGGWLNAYGIAVSALATIAIAGFTFTLERSTRALWRASETQRADLEITTKRELRAYVGVSYAEIRIDRGSDEEFNKLVAFVDYQNAGATPAHDVDVRMSAKIYGFNIIPAWEKPITIEDEGKGGLVLPAVTWRRHREVDRSSPTDFDALIRALTNSKKRVWIWGTITYRDIFDEECNAEFRFWSSDVKRTKKSGVEYFATIADIAHTRATYGKDS